MRKDGPTVSIPFPRPTQNVNRGYLIEVPKTRPTSIRFTDDDRTFIDGIANKLHMSFGEFVKWCAYYTALEVSKAKDLEQFTGAEAKPVDLDLEGFE